MHLWNKIETNFVGWTLGFAWPVFFMLHQRLETTALCTGLKQQRKECSSYRLTSRKEMDMYLKVFRATEGRVYLAQFRIKESCISHTVL